MKKIFLIFSALFFLSASLQAQEKQLKDYDRFEKSFTTNVNYPVDLIRNCKSIFCLLKITINANHNVVDLNLSDNTDSLFKIEFIKNRKLLDIAALEQFIKTDFTNNIAGIYIIPINYSILYKESCPQQEVAMASLANYCKFNNTPLYGNITVLKPIVNKIMINN